MTSQPTIHRFPSQPTDADRKRLDIVLDEAVAAIHARTEQRRRNPGARFPGLVIALDFSRYVGTKNTAKSKGKRNADRFAYISRTGSAVGVVLELDLGDVPISCRRDLPPVLRTALAGAQ